MNQIIDALLHGFVGVFRVTAFLLGATVALGIVAFIFGCIKSFIQPKKKP